ncbi:MAG: PKD domain-containing protein [Bacteroidales bacterium]|nr:PKD domain-containing protein [Bacteroidales bacterium]
MINPIAGATADEVQNLTAGTWYVRVTDSNGCQATGQVTISQPPQITGSASVTATISCYGGNDGEITVTAGGGSGNLEYELNGDSNWISSGIFADLTAGSYTIRVRDAANHACIISLPALTVSQPPELIVSLVSKTDVFCFGGSGGTISINSSGGTIPAGGYLYEWSGTDYLGNTFSSTQKNLTGLRAGTYSVRVTDANSCQAVLADIIVSQPPELVISLDDVTNVLCFNESTGEIQITVSGGVMPSEGYYFTWTGTTFQGMTFNSFVEDLSALKAGTYSLTVRDANGCSAVLPPVTITQPVELTVVTESITNVECFDESTGAVDITVTGGTVPAGGYLFSWTGMDYSGNVFTGNTEDLEDMKAGTYMLTVTDANNCSVTLPAVNITQPPVLNVSVISQTDVLCFGESTGTISVSVTGGTMPSGGYYYDWTGVDYLGNSFSATTRNLTGITAGTYNLTVTDENGCTASILPVTISMPDALTLDVNVISDYNGRDISCAGASDGRAEAVVTGGTGIYFYTWYSDPLFSVPIGQMGAVAINLAAGDYYVRVMDMNGCSITDVVVLEEPQALEATVTSKTDVGCFGEASGAVTVTVTAGTGTEPYVFSKDGGSTWQDNGTFTGLTAMPYTILVRDINNCLISVPVVITQPVQLMATITGTTNVSCNGGNNGAVTATVSAGSGTAPYEFSINGTDWQSSGTFTGLTAGSYSLLVHDARGCTVTLPVMITEPPVLTLTATPDVVLDCYNDNDGMGTFYATGGTPGYTFTELENSALATIPVQGYNTQVFFGAGSGTVSFRVTDSKGCIAEASVILTQPSALLPGSIADNQVLCYGEMPEMIEELSGPSGGPQPADYRYQWQYSITGSEPFISIAGATGPDYTPAEAATGTLYYRRMVTSGFCQPVYSNVVEIVVNPRPIAVLRGGAIICPGESAVLNVDMLAGTGPFEIEIEPGITIGNYTSGDPIIVTPALTTTYRLVRVSDANSCEVSSPSPNVSGEAIVEVSALPSITSFIPSPDVCEFSFAAFSVTATGSNLTYQWWVNDGNGYDMVEDGGTYFGANSNNLLIFTSLREMDGFVYKVVVSGCGIEVESDEAVFRVNTAPELTLHPKDTVICLGQNAIMEADATGDGITWQWFVNRGTGFTPVTDDGILFSGAATNSLTVINPPFSATPWVFRAIADGDCGVPVYTGFAVMRVLNPPLVTRQPEVDPICEGGNIQLNASGTNYTSLQWQVNTGGVWTDVTDEAPYLGARSQQLNIMNVPLSYDGYRYRLAFITSCAVVYTDEVALTINANPVVSFTEDPVFACGGEDNILNGNPSGGSGVFTSHRWTGDVGPLSSYVDANPVFNTLVPGDYYLNYRVQDSNGCTATGDVTVTVDSPSAMFTHDADFGCTPLPVTFEADLDEVVKWWWDFDDGSPLDSISTNPVHVFVNDDPASISYHEVSLRVMSAGGCYASFSSTIMVYPGIDADFSPDRDVICSGETVFFTSTQGASRYYWDFGDLSTGYASNNTSHMFVNHSDSPVTYTVRLTTTSFYNCIDEETHEITILPVPVPQFSALPPTQIYNASGNSVTFINETNEGSWTWLWRFGDGSTSAEESPVHNYTTMGEFNVTLLVSNDACSDSVSQIVSVFPPPPVADFDSIPSGCAPLYIQINNTSLNTELPGTTYKWDFADGSQSTAKNPTYTFFTPGSYRIELVVTGPGGPAYKSQVVNVYPSPKAYFEVTPTKVIVNDERVRCFNLSEGASSYVWDFGDGDTSRMKEPYHKYMEEGVYDITLWAYSENGCTDQYVLSPAVTVDPPGVLRFATVFTPNREGPIERTDLPTGGVEIDQFFFPPVRDRVLDYKLQVFNRWGVLIFESHDINVPWNGYYNGTLCQQGVYVWYVEGKYSDGRPYKQVGNVTLLH